MITSQKITYYLLDDNGGTNSLIVDLVNDEIISTSQEVEMITFGKFRDNDGVANLLIVKHYVYAILNNNYFCHVKLNEIVGFPPEVTAIKCMNNFCYYVVGIINYNKELKLFLYKNPSYNCKGYCAHTSTINGIGSNNFNCHLMKSYSNEDILVCFYQKQDSNQLTADRLTIFIDDNSCSTTSSETNPKELSYGIKIIKSSLSQDYKQAFVCFIDSNNDCKCLIYNSFTNQWSDSNTYLSCCLSELSSLNIEYFDNRNEYVLYCFQSQSKFDLQKLDSNYGKKEDEENGIYDLSSSLGDCTDYYISSLIHNSENINMFVSCNNNIISLKAIKYIPTTIITTILTTLPLTTIITTLHLTTILTTLPETKILTTLPETTILTTLPETTILTTMPETTTPYTTIINALNNLETTLIYIPRTTNMEVISSLAIKIDNNEIKIIIIKETNAKSKEEVVDEVDEIMKEHDVGKIYEIFGEDYNIKISPINTKNLGNISNYIEFANCENILREKNDLNAPSILTVLQIEIKNRNKQSLINNVEYAVYNDKKEKLDLSVLKKNYLI